MSRLQEIKDGLARVNVKDDGDSPMIADIRWAVGEIVRLRSLIKARFHVQNLPKNLDSDERRDFVFETYTRVFEDAIIAICREDTATKGESP